MCGIAGIAAVDGVSRDDEALVIRMLESLAHRGPDDQHHFSDEHAIIGSRRLAIIDLDTGRQPLGNEDGTIQISQNGEIYNYVELREELLRAGTRCATHGDTEAIVHLYEEFGARLRRAPPRHVRHRPLGRRPGGDSSWRATASARSPSTGGLPRGADVRLGAQDDHGRPAQPRNVDRNALAQFLQYQYVPAPRTILEGVHKLPPASVLVWDGGEPRSTYWKPTYEPKSDPPPGGPRRLPRVIRESVRLRLRSDVPVGCS